MNRLLAFFGRTRRPRSWLVFAVGTFGFTVTVIGAIPEGLSAFDDQAVAWLLVMFEGMGLAEEVEQDIGSVAAVDEKDA